MKLFSRFCLPLVSLFCFTACDVNSNKEVDGEKKSPPSGGEKKVVKVDTKIDLGKEAMEVASRLEKAVKSKDKKTVGEFFDMELILDNAFEGIKLPAEFKGGMQAGLDGAKVNLVNDLTNAKFDRLNLVKGGEIPTVRFRIRREGGLEYVDYEFKKRATGEWHIIDTHAYSVGSKLSQLLRDGAMPLLAQMDKSLVTRFLQRSKGQSQVQYAQKLQAMTTAIRQPNGAEKVIEIFDSLPEEVQKRKSTLIIYMAACTKLPDFIEPDSRYAKAIELFQTTFPNDPSAALHSIDANIIKKDFAASHQAVKELGRITGDPYLDFFRGYIFMHEKKFTEVEKQARQWIKLEPEDSEGWEMLLEAGFGRSAHGVTAESLTELEKNFGMDFSGVTNIPEWAPFVISEPGQQWLKKRSQN